MKLGGGYLLGQVRRLAAGLADLPKPLTERAERFVLSCRDSAGAFAGRSGPGDLYYTAFALRCLGILGRLDEQTADSALKFAASQPCHHLVDWVSRLFIEALCRRQARTGNREQAWEPVGATVNEIERYRCADGGYGKAPGGSASSTYHTFLAWLCHDLAGCEPPQAQAVGSFVRARRRDDGGFAELSASPASSTNPTAAGTALALLTGQADEAMLLGVVEFLLGQQRGEGGWPVSPRSPSADLLSTFTTLITLADLGVLEQANMESARRFVEGCRCRSGGFGAQAGDEPGDVEYTFYGLGALIVLG